MDSIGKSLQIYCINLKERSDRWQRFMNQPGIQKLIQYYPLERIEGVDGKKLNIAEDQRVSLRTRRNILLQKRRDHEDLDSPGGVGCYLSHYASWKKSLGTSQKYCLILEDDAMIPDDFMEKLETGIEDFEQNAKQADVWFLSRPWGDFLSRALSKARPDYDERGWTFNFICPGTGYILTKQAARILCDHAFPIDGHVDFYIHRCAQMGLLVEAHKNDFSLTQYRFGKHDSNIQDQQNCAICNIPVDPDKKGYLILTNQQMTAAAVGIAVAGGLYFLRMFAKSR
jgi:GR25 family glycosyltransferase involved in LPS biosynthesis